MAQTQVLRAAWGAHLQLQLLQAGWRLLHKPQHLSIALAYLQLQLFPVLLCLFLMVRQLLLQVTSPGICPLCLLLSSGQLPLQLLQALFQLLL